uniref:Uncharacterized protein n=1 Tax=Brassica oleracea TaxID=3712 RepID=A0A3P6F7B2_BRAOL|nr:unnamed protein product [Brassica oleracea]
MAKIALRADVCRKVVSWKCKGSYERPWVRSMNGSYQYRRYVIRIDRGILVHEEPCGVQGPIDLEPAASRGGENIAEDFPKVLGLWGWLAE